jgi:hypothetical protein
MNTYSNKPQGYILLIGMIIIGAVGIMILVSNLLFGTASTDSSSDVISSSEARFLADACAEEGLQQIKLNNSFASSGSLILAGDTCFYQVSNLGGNNRQIDVIATSTQSTTQSVKRLRILINALSPKVNISSWSEI